MKHLLSTLALILSGNAFAAPAAEVIVLGTMHQMHEDMPYYTFADLERLVVELAPDVLCLELQPGDLEGRPDEPNKREYPEVIYPLLDAGSYRTYAMEPPNPLFAELLKPIIAANKALREQRPDRAAALDAYIEATYGMLGEYWRSPAAVNNTFTDLVFQAKHEAQSKMVGPAEAEGWRAWNGHFLSVIRTAASENPGKRIVVIVGAEHGYWLRRALREDASVHLLDTPSVLESIHNSRH